MHRTLVYCAAFLYIAPHPRLLLLTHVLRRIVVCCAAHFYYAARLCVRRIDVRCAANIFFVVCYFSADQDTFFYIHVLLLMVAF